MQVICVESPMYGSVSIFDVNGKLLCTITMEQEMTDPGLIKRMVAQLEAQP